MLIGFSLENISSFKDVHNLSMEISEQKKDEILLQNTIEVGNGTNLLKSALIYGANASGKTNLFKAIDWFKSIILLPKENLSENEMRRIIPFILNKENLQKPSEFEIIFIENNLKYRYGLSIFEGEILEEWLYYTKSRETLLFHRENLNIQYNKSAFGEAKLFVLENGNGTNKGTIQRTAKHIPFVSVLSFTDGIHSKNVTNFFERIHFVSGANDEKMANYTFNFAHKNPEFRTWLLEILKDFHIADLVIKEEEFSHKIEVSLNNNDKVQLLEGDIKKLNVRIKKHMNHSEENVEIPIELESSGTRKIIHLLGPIYDTIKNGNILLIDEFDSKFHTLLSKHIFKLFHQNSKNSQIIANVQDTNLMDTDFFRRDQIWFVDKNPVTQDSQLYSLSEYKINKQKSYSQDYLNGAFDAIPLFSSIDEINSLME